MMARVPRRLGGIGAEDLPNAAAFDAYVGPSRELLVDPARGVLALHDGLTPGGKVFIDRAAILAYLGGKANNSRIDGLEQAIGEGFDQVEQNFSSVQASIGTKANASAVTSLTATVTQQGQDITATASAVTAVQAALPGKASASAVTALTATVSQQGDTITAQGQAITQVNAALPGKASAAALTSLTSTVTAQGDTISAHSQSITQVSAEVGGKASATAVSSLTTLVNQQGDNITTLSQTITQVNASLAGKASATALSSLSASVSSIDGRVTATSTALTEVNAAVGDVSAEGRMRFEAVAGDAGYAAFQLQLRYNTSQGHRAAGMAVRVPSDPAQPSVMVLNADRLEIVAGDAVFGTKIFYADSSGVYIPNAFFRSVTVDKIQFGDGTILMSAVPQKGVHDVQFSGQITAVTVTNVFQNVVLLDASKTVADAIIVTGDCRVRATALASGAATLLVELWEDNVMVKEGSLKFTDTINSQHILFYYVRNIEAGTYNYKIVVKRSATGEDFQIGRRTLAAVTYKKA